MNETSPRAPVERIVGRQAPGKEEGMKATLQVELQPFQTPMWISPRNSAHVFLQPDHGVGVSFSDSAHSFNFASKL